MEQKVNYPAEQFKFLKQFYNLTFPAIAQKSGVSTGAVHNVLNGTYKDVQVGTLAAVANAMNADVVIMLKPRDPQFREHVQAMLGAIPSSE